MNTFDAILSAFLGSMTMVGIFVSSRWVVVTIGELYNKYADKE